MHWSPAVAVFWDATSSSARRPGRPSPHPRPRKLSGPRRPRRRDVRGDVATGKPSSRRAAAWTSCSTPPRSRASAGPGSTTTASTPGDAARRRGLPRPRRRPACLHQQPERHLRRGDQRGVDESAPYPRDGWPIIRTARRWPKQHVLASQRPAGCSPAPAAASDLGAPRSAPDPAAARACPQRPAAPGGRRDEPYRHGLRRERRRSPSCRPPTPCGPARSSPAGLTSSARANRSTAGMDRRDPRPGGLAAGRASRSRSRGAGRSAR